MPTPAPLPPPSPSPSPSPASEPDAAARAARFWTPRHVAEVVAGRWLHEPADLDRPLAGLSTDTRTLRRDEIFLAIAGPTFDGHAFLDAAFKAGAAMAIVEKAADAHHPASTLAAVLHVKSTLAALQRLAHAWRDVLAVADCRVIAVVGSNGKTTTRHLIHTALHNSALTDAAALARHEKPETRNQKPDPVAPQRLTGTQSPRSFNNHLGVPLTLLAAKAGHDFVVAEIGTNHPGEIAQLAEIARPDAVVITSIGQEHMAAFGSLEGVAREEAAVLDHVVKDGLAVIEADAWRHITALRELPAHLRVVRAGEGDAADVRCEAVTETPTGLCFQAVVAPNADLPSAIPHPPSPIALPLLGRHNASNALAAVVMGRWMGVPDAQLAAQLARASAVPGRLELRPIGTPPHAVHVLHDAYNANPDSMRAALATLAKVTAPTSATEAASASKPETRNQKPETQLTRRVAVLGDMGELGPLGPDAHRQLGEDLAAHRETIDRVLLVGRLTLFTAEALARHWPNERMHVVGPMNDAAAERIAEMLQPGDVVLLKASRSVALERVLPAIEKRFGV